MATPADHSCGKKLVSRIQNVPSDKKQGTNYVHWWSIGESRGKFCFLYVYRFKSCPKASTSWLRFVSFSFCWTYNPPRFGGDEGFLKTEDNRWLWIGGDFPPWQQGRRRKATWGQQRARERQQWKTTLFAVTPNSLSRCISKDTRQYLANPDRLWNSEMAGYRYLYVYRSTGISSNTTTDNLSIKRSTSLQCSTPLIKNTAKLYGDALVFID